MTTLHRNDSKNALCAAFLTHRIINIFIAKKIVRLVEQPIFALADYFRTNGIPEKHLIATMFILAELKDTIRIPPEMFNLKLIDAVKDEINRKLANKVEQLRLDSAMLIYTPLLLIVFAGTTECRIVYRIEGNYPHRRFDHSAGRRCIAHSSALSIHCFPTAKW